MAGARQVIIITGPTGVGKTDFADALALKLPIEIINADMGQLYAPLSIGTAKPDWRSSATPHHLFDLLNEPVDYTAVAYRTRVIETVESIWARNRIPVIVGGSLFYIKSLFFAPQAQPVVSSVSEGPELVHGTWQQLHAIDPVRAQKIHSNDFYRIQRALALWHTTGIKPSTLTPSFAPIAPHITLLFLTRDKDDLHGRIAQRVAHMADAGWLREVEALQSTAWEPFLQRKKLIGYNELLLYTAQHHSQPDMLDAVWDTITQRTRSYAKRQHTFWRMLVKQLHEAYATSSCKTLIESVNLTSLNLDLYIGQLSGMRRE